MMGSLLTRGLIMALGYAYPAYKCYKSVEIPKPDAEQLSFWCQYWILMALVTILERFGDIFISWFPFYNEAKLAFIIYLWAPKTLGTSYVYSSLLKPLVSTHEGEIDRCLNELSTRAGDVAYQYWAKGSEFAQSRVMELVQSTMAQASRASRQEGSDQTGEHPLKERRWSWSKRAD